MGLGAASGHDSLFCEIQLSVSIFTHPADFDQAQGRASRLGKVSHGNSLSYVTTWRSGSISNFSRAFADAFPRCRESRLVQNRRRELRLPTLEGLDTRRAVEDTELRGDHRWINTTSATLRNRSTRRSRRRSGNTSPARRQLETTHLMAKVAVAVLEAVAERPAGEHLVIRVVELWHTTEIASALCPAPLPGSSPLSGS